MSTDAPTAFPLTWPHGRPRFHGVRHRAAFRVRKSVPGYTFTRAESLTVAEALARLLAELERLGVARLVISTNVPVRNDGLPYSTAREPQDPGVAVYFTRSRKPYVLACDRWD